LMFLVLKVLLSGRLSKVNGRDIIKKYLGKDIPKRRSEKVKLRIIKKFTSQRGLSLIHFDVINSLPRKEHLWSRVPSISPKSYQTKAGKRMRRILISELKKDNRTQKVNNKIGNKEISIYILYKLVSKRKQRDIDNYTKNIIDGLHEGGLFNDDSQIKFHTSKIEYINVKDEKYSTSLEKPIIIVELFNESDKVISEFNNKFRNE